MVALRSARPRLRVDVEVGKRVRVASGKGYVTDLSIRAPQSTWDTLRLTVTNIAYVPVHIEMVVILNPFRYKAVWVDLRDVKLPGSLSPQERFCFAVDYRRLVEWGCSRPDAVTVWDGSGNQVGRKLPLWRMARMIGWLLFGKCHPNLRRKPNEVNHVFIEAAPWP